jgi:hypothetical protein
VSYFKSRPQIKLIKCSAGLSGREQASLRTGDPGARQCRQDYAARSAAGPGQPTASSYSGVQQAHYTQRRVSLCHTLRPRRWARHSRHLAWYLPEVHGVVFVVDATDRERVSEARTVLHATAAHAALQGKPLLVLANKQDQAAACCHESLATLLELGSLPVTR